jgi:hypothetical protein
LQHVKRTQQLHGSWIVWLNLIGHFSPIIPPFAHRGLSRHVAWSASGDELGNQGGLEGWSVMGGISAGPTNRRRSPQHRPFYILRSLILFT